MSWYTTIHPTGDQWDYKNIPQEEVDDNLKIARELKDKAWKGIVSLFTYIPKDVDDVDAVKAKCLQRCDEYEEASKNEDYWYFINEMKSEWGEGTISINHFEYSQRPQDGIEENTKYINGIKDKLVMMATGDPRAYAAAEDVEGGKYDGAIEWLDLEVPRIKEFYDQCLFDMHFSEVYAQFESTATYG